MNLSFGRNVFRSCWVAFRLGNDFDFEYFREVGKLFVCKPLIFDRVITIEGVLLLCRSKTHFLPLKVAVKRPKSTWGNKKPFAFWVNKNAQIQRHSCSTGNCWRTLNNKIQYRQLAKGWAKRLYTFSTFQTVFRWGKTNSALITKGKTQNSINKKRRLEEQGNLSIRIDWKGLLHFLLNCTL